MRREPTGEEFAIVFKVGYGDGLKLLSREARRYAGPLVQLQGQAVPRMYGSFVGHTDEGKTRVSVFEDCGKQLRAPLMMQPLKFRQAVVNSLVQIHRSADLMHGNFTERHVVVKKVGEDYFPVIVDFTYARRHLYGPEECTGVSLPLPETYTPAPDRSESETCDELFEVMMNDAQLWYPAHVEYFGRQVPAEAARDLRELVKYAPEDRPEWEAQYVACHVHEELERWIHDRARWDRGPVCLQDDDNF
ncbi:hypothetical protein FKP32DRAFT_1595048 [Trametes sanguinea]|nr:hypothetical protein FKP32DRAFT_1595048 [Trametes sanguinea]